MFKMPLFDVAFATYLLMTTTIGHPSSLNCQDLMLSVSISGPSYDLDIVHVNNNIEAVEFALDLDKWSAPNVTERIIGVTNITQTYSIYAQLCRPDPAKDKHVMQILSHGLAFDHRYCTLTGVSL
jgi:hypothetical protein